MKIRDMKIVREVLMTRDVMSEAGPAEESNALGNDVANAPIHTGRAMRLRPLLGCLILCLLPLIVMPQQAARQETKQADEEEQMDSALRKLGYVSGQACQCEKQKDAKTKFERQSLDIANGILRLFGSDRAFYYAVAYGAGLTAEMDQKKCTEAIKEFETMLAKLRVLAAK